MMHLLGEMRMENLQRRFAPLPAYRIINGKMVIPDGSKFDAAVNDRIRQNHIRSMKFSHALLGVSNGWFNRKNRQEPIPLLGFDFRTKEGRKGIAEYFRLYNDHMKEKFPGITNYIHIYDEPPR